MSVERFVADLASIGVAAEAHQGLVIFEVAISGGQLDGTTTEAAVEVKELSGWPLVHPHWLHLPSSIQFSKTNSRPSSRAGWTRHSRAQATPSSAKRSGADWVAHVRGILTEAA